MIRYFAAPLVLLALSGLLAAVLTVTDDHSDAAVQAQGRSFAQRTKAICTDAASAASGAPDRRAAAIVDRAAVRVGAVPEPPNIHRAVARLVLHWHRGAKLLASGRSGSQAYTTERHEAFLSAHLLNAKACMHVLPKR
jgi:hypothetical protein